MVFKVKHGCFHSSFPPYQRGRASFRGNFKVQNTLFVQQGLQHSERGQPVGDTPYGGLKAPPFGEIPLETASAQGGGVWQTHFCAKNRNKSRNYCLSLICCGKNERGSL